MQVSKMQNVQPRVHENTPLEPTQMFKNPAIASGFNCVNQLTCRPLSHTMQRENLGVFQIFYHRCCSLNAARYIFQRSSLTVRSSEERIRKLTEFEGAVARGTIEAFIKRHTVKSTVAQQPKLP
jgi:hypothetical protein